MATLKLLVAARDARVKRFLFASSSAIYGDSDAPFGNAKTDMPSHFSPYALQKFAAEKYGQMFPSALRIGNGEPSVTSMFLGRGNRSIRLIRA